MTTRLPSLLNARRLSYLLLALLVALVWGRTIGAEFVFWDDGDLIYQNPHVMTEGAGTLVETWKQPHAAMYIPAVYNLWWVLATIGRAIGGPFAQHGVPPWPFHLANVCFHLINACLVLKILWRIGLPRWPAFVGAAIFAVHPLQAEPVSWATGMKDVFSTFFALGSIAAYLRASAAWDKSPLKAHGWFSVSLVAAFLGTLAKPGIIGVPAIAALLDVVFISGIRRAAVLRFALLALVLLPSVVWTSMAQKVPYEGGISVWFRPTIAAHAIGFYLQKLLVPSNLCIEYGFRPSIVVVNWKHVSLAFAAPAALFMLLLARGHRKHLAVAAAVFIAGIFPVLGLVPFAYQFWSTVADRYVYLAMLGPAIGAAYLLSLAQVRIMGFAGAAILVGLGWLSLEQTRVWQDTVALMDRTLQVNPLASSAYCNFAGVFCPPPPPPTQQNEANNAVPAALGMSQELGSELVELAQSYWEKSFILRPEAPDAMKNMLWNRAGRGRFREAVGLMEIVITMFPERVFPMWVHPVDAAWLYLQVGNTQKAMDMLDIAYLQDANHPRILPVMLETLKKQSQTTQPATTTAHAE